MATLRNCCGYYHGANTVTLLSVLLIFFACCSHHGVDSSGYCYHDDSSPYRNYSTQTPYRYQQPERARDAPRGCTAKQIWFLARAGTSTPPSSETERQAQFLEQLQAQVMSTQSMIDGSLCQQDLLNIRNWPEDSSWPYGDRQLTETGRQEMEDIGRRFSEKYPDLLGVKYEERYFEFRHASTRTAGSKARDSARAFAKGAFNYNEGVVLEEESDSDWLLNYYNKCQRYQDDVYNQPIEDLESRIHTPHFQGMIQRLKERTGMLQSNFSYDDILRIYDACRQGVAVDGNSPWCALLTPDALENLEFLEDVKTYWREGYGNRINYQQACPLLQNMLESFRSVVENEGTAKKFVGIFGDVTNLLTFQASMELFRDATTPGNEGYGGRSWMTSRNAPFAGNVAVVLYRCEQAYAVQVYANEQLVQITNRCALSCPFESFENIFSHSADNCNMDKICNNKAAASATRAGHVLSNTVVLVILTILHYVWRI